ncbi:hypothetical protein ACHAXN_000349 [Cyclotella atomus]
MSSTERSLNTFKPFSARPTS